MQNIIVKRITLILDHMQELRQRKAQIEGDIHSETARDKPDNKVLHWLKVRRLMVHDQIARYEEIMRDLTPGTARKVGVT